MTAAPRKPDAQKILGGNRINLGGELAEVSSSKLRHSCKERLTLISGVDVVKIQAAD